MYFLGTDAGGSKTAFILSDVNGKILARHNTGPCAFLRAGSEKLTDIMNEGINAVCGQANITVKDITYSALGIPGYGEKEGVEAEIKNASENAGLSGKIVCECDCYIGWAGSLAMQPGVNIISGTGSICYGVNQSGVSARSSGWGAYSDEGSCKWMGGKLLSLFTKQSDGRLPRTELYGAIRKYFGIKEDLHFIHTLNYGLDNVKIARLQIVISELYDSDIHARALYDEAAEELALAASAVGRKLMFPEGYAVSYSGGLFRSGEKIQKPLGEKLAERGCRLTEPRFSPELGAVLMAMRQIFRDKNFESFSFYE